jgi:glutathione synthase/RimK-type ligase-like ATP-grasp enzyme
MDRLRAIPLPALPICVAQLFKKAFDGYDLKPLRSQIIARTQSNPLDAAGLLDLSVIEQLLGNLDSGLAYQDKALRLQRLYRSSWPTSSRPLRVLAFMAPGDIGTNTPTEFLLERSDVVLHMLYIVPGQSIPRALPEHDVAIVTVCESDKNRPILNKIDQLIPGWPRPVLNNPRGILNLSREKMYSFLQTVPGLVMPATIRIGCPALEQIGNNFASIEEILGGATFPLIVRPIESHAGKSLAKLDTTSSISGYLADQQEAEFYVSRFIDYRSSDGQYRKYRIIWVDGHPYPCHMAITEDWKIWYYNAGMGATAAKRDEEAHFMETFDTGFVRRHATALAAIAEQFGLEYFGIDCAELPDGRLLVFEGDNTLVVHDMDPPDLYPYKSPHMQKLFTAFRDMLKCKSMAASVAV